MATARKRKVSSENRPLTAVPTDPAVQAWVHLAHAYHRIARRLESALDDHGLTLAQFEVLARLHFDGAISQNELAQRLLVTKGNICGLLDRMAAADLVTRMTDPKDRRVNQLHMTVEGRRKFAAAFPDHIDKIRELMADLLPHDQNSLRQLLAVLSGSEKC
jgi:DNA-binding MarR family transcriptional regulator